MTATRDRNALHIAGDSLTVIPRGLDKVWGVRRRVNIPLSSITEVRIERDPHRVPMGWRGPGLDIFWKLVGTFHPGNERHYWNYAGPGEALNLRLDDSQYFRELYLSVGNAEAALQRISDALLDQHAPGTG